MSGRVALTHDRLLSLLDYELLTGIFRWIEDRGRVKAGSVAGTVNVHGYVAIKIDQRLFLAHRLAVFWMTGLWPAIEIDHRDRNGTNNAWANIRTATRAQNSRNGRKRINNTTGFKGVVAVPWGFAAKITVDGKRHYLGSFATAELAHAAYCSAAERLHGEFARTA